MMAQLMLMHSIKSLSPFLIMRASILLGALLTKWAMRGVIVLTGRLQTLAAGLARETSLGVR